MFASAGSPFFSTMESRHCLLQHSFSGKDFMQINALSAYAHFQYCRSWKPQAAGPGPVVAVSSAYSSPARSSSPPSSHPKISFPPPERTRCLEDSKFINRRAFAAFVGIFSPATSLWKARADEIMSNGVPDILDPDQSEGMQQDMFQKLDQARQEKRPNKAVLDRTKDVTKEPDTTVTAKSISEATPNNILTTVIDNRRHSTLREKFSVSEVEGWNSINFLGILGLLGAVGLGGLYRLELETRYSLEIALQDITAKLKAKEVAINTLVEQFEHKLAEAEEQDVQQSMESIQETEALKDKLLSAENFAESLVERLIAEKKLTEEQDKQIKRLQMSVEELRKQVKRAIESQEETKASQLQEENEKLKSELDKRTEVLDSLRMIWKEQEHVFEDLGLQLTETVQGLFSQARSKDRNIRKINGIDQTPTWIDLLGKLASATKYTESLIQEYSRIQREYYIFKYSSAQEMNKARDLQGKLDQKVQALERRLGAANTKADELEAEKSSLSMSLDEEKQASETLKDKVKLLDDGLGQLSKEKENYAYRAKEIEEKLASAEGEVLRLQDQLMDKEREEPGQGC